MSGFRAHENDQDVIIREFFDEVENRHNKVNRKAESTINENIEKYKSTIADNATYHLIMMKRKIQDGKHDSAEYHKMMAEIYTSIIDKV